MVDDRSKCFRSEKCQSEEWIVVVDVVLKSMLLEGPQAVHINSTCHTNTAVGKRERQSTSHSQSINLIILFTAIVRYHKFITRSMSWDQSIDLPSHCRPLPIVAVEAKGPEPPTGDSQIVAAK